MTDKLQTLIEKLEGDNPNEYETQCSQCEFRSIKPILIGDIIFKINQAQVSKLVQLWRPFGNKSLQEIGEMKEQVRECECGKITPHKPLPPDSKCRKHRCFFPEQLKPEAQELISFICELFNV